MPIWRRLDERASRAKASRSARSRSDSVLEAAERTPRPTRKNQRAGDESESAQARVSAPSPVPAGHYYTIVHLIHQNGIVETQLHPGDPGAPTVHLPTPPGWADAGSTTPRWAWRAILFTDPAMAADPPNIITLVSKLTGNGVARVLSYAPGELKNMADFKGDRRNPEEGRRLQRLSARGHVQKEGRRHAGNRADDGCVPASDGVFIMQCNADGGADQLGLLRDTMRIMDEQTTITP